MLHFLPLLAIVAVSYIVAAPVDPRDSGFDQSIPSQFAGNPAVKFRPHVFWHWVNGNINKDGIDRDIEALYNSGYGGVLMYDVNAGIPKGPVEFNSDEWLDLLVYTLQGLKAKGMDFAMHNSPGYSGVGSENLPVNMTMKELTWTETPIAANSINTTLAHPFHKMGVYEDLYVLAYPAAHGEGVPWRDAVAKVTLDEILQTTNITSTINLEQPLRLSTSSDYLTFEMMGLWTAQSIAVYRIPETPQNTFDGARDYPPSWTLKASNDSLTWTNIVTFSGPALRAMDAPATGVFNPITAKYYRLQPNGPSWVTGVELTGGARLTDWATKSHAAPGGDVSNPAVITAVPSTSIIDPNSVIDVSKYLDSNGYLHWTPTNGTYTAVRIGYTVTGQYMPATPDGHAALSADLFSTNAIDAQFDTHLNRIIQAVKPFIPETFFGMEIDSYELGMQNWGGNLAEDFESCRGYSILPWLLSATGRILESAEATEKFLFDFRLTHAHLTATKSYGYYAQRLGEHGIALLSEPYGDGPFDGMEVASQVTYAYGEFWTHNTYGSDGYTEIGTSREDAGFSKLAIRGVNFEESFTGQPVSSAHTEHPYQLKAQGDREMSLGTNRFYMHDYCLQPVEAAWPGMMFGGFGAHFDRHATWTEQSIAWMTEITRASFILQSGTRLPDTLSFWGEEMSNGAPITYDSPYSVPLSYQQDVFSRADLFDLLPVNGKAVWPSGTGVSLLTFPSMPAASVQLLQRIIYLAKSGVPILLQPTVPSRGLGLNDRDTEIVALATELWGMAGNGNVFVGETAASVLNSIGLTPDLTFTSPSNDAAIYFGHNLLDGEDVYFVTNQLRRPLDAVISLRAISRTPQIWDPATGEITPAIWSSSSGRTEVSISFDPYQSVFIWLSKSEASSLQITSISLNEEPLYTTIPYAPFTNTPWANVSGTWTLSVWAKPEVAEFGQTGYIFYPPVSSAYGTRHSAAGLYFALNGLELVEASTSTPSIIASLPGPWTGAWTHIAIVYTNNLPTIYANGNLVYMGTKSSSVVHPGLDAEDNVNVMMHRFSGDIAGINVNTTALSQSEIQALYTAGVPDPYLPKAASLTPTSELLIRQNGSYTITSSSNTSTTIKVSSVTSTTLSNPWTVTFPPQFMPKNTQTLSIELEKLESLHMHPNFDVAHFSGTATYSTTFNLKSLSSALLLTLGRVENIATVYLNGQNLGISWLPPYEIDITRSAHTGANLLVVEVTNLWVNRLIGDEYLPVEDVFNTNTQNYAVEEWPQWWIENLPVKTGERVTFGAWHHYNSSAPLLASGLLGPVRITAGVLEKLDGL
ncbi:uncharacterized protein PAC_15487 [Phialocephala subalpina]|uniref:F5/8 type C domain-containing protein n=1 Tax=Phialocephala subalpina TaxID=576137 RepID=A0A1L7XKX6_9HELO|nr:uncharacterized protein PAC_15487 [Phialocephala subalpina]